jgi:acetylornithine/N-succinyldiaminopimelate aminotransferase
MSVGNAVLDKIFKKGFLKSVQKISKYFHNELNKIKNDYPKLIKEVRGIGFLIGLQLFNDPTQFIKKLQDNKLLTIRSGENTIRILPPLIVKKAEIDIAIKIIRKVCKEF